MRKVKYVTHGFFGGKNSNAPGLVKEGWFHGIYQVGSTSTWGVEAIVVVESLIGELVSISLNQVKFELQPDEEKQELRTRSN